MAIELERVGNEWSIRGYSAEKNAGPLAFLRQLQAEADGGFHRDLRAWVHNKSSVARVLTEYWGSESVHLTDEELRDLVRQANEALDLEHDWEWREAHGIPIRYCLTHGTDHTTE